MRRLLHGFLFLHFYRQLQALFTRLKAVAKKENRNFLGLVPDTGVAFNGFQIPCFEQAKEMVLLAALESDKILVVGWDVAISDKEPVIIEGNRRPGFDMVQTLDEGGRQDIVYQVLASLEKQGF